MDTDTLKLRVSLDLIKFKNKINQKNMKNVIIILILACITVTTFAQDDFIIIYPNNNQEVGFGYKKKCTDDLPYVVNGPLYGPDKMPVGGYVTPRYSKRNGTYYLKGKKMKDWVDPSEYDGNFSQKNGIFGLSQNGMILKKYSDWVEEPEKLLWGFQNGMILLLDEENDHNQSSVSKFIRSGIGYLPDNSLIVIISTVQVSFYELAEAFKTRGCQNAIYLDGFSSTVGYATRRTTRGLKPDAIKLQFYH